MIHWTAPRPRTRWILALAGAASAGAIAVTVLRPRPPPIVAPIAMPTAPIVVLPPAPHGEVQVPAPPAPPEPPPAPPPRANAPHLDAGCVLSGMVPGLMDGVSRVSCEWDDGFPAISADGTRVAIKRHPDDGGRGYPGMMIDFIDVATSKVVRDIVVLDPDEFDPENPAKHERKATRRVAEAQALLDAGHYRSLDLVGGPLASTPEPDPADAARIHAEVDDADIRIVDPATNRALWRDHIAIPRPRPLRGDDCDGWSIYRTTVWWDAKTRTVLVDQIYRSGGCLCRDEAFASVRRF
jgi:hypothetical protein